MPELKNVVIQDLQGDVMDVTDEGSLSFSLGGSLVIEQFDAITVTYPTETQEVYSYRTGGASGTVVVTVTLTYVDSTKERVLQVVKS